MKRRPLLMARIAAAVIAACSVVCTVSLPVCSYVCTYAASNVTEAGAELREHLRAHDENFTVTFTGSDTINETYVDRMFETALAETGRGTDGDYIRYGIYSLGYAPVVTNFRVSGLEFSVVYTSTAAQEASLNNAIASAESQLALSSKNDYEKVSAVYSYITSHVTYGKSGETELFSAYSALVNGKAVCQGVAQLMYRMLTDAGLSCRIIPGYGNGGDHAWNIVSVGGKYYYIDATWDLQTKPERYSFFLRGSSDLDEIGNSNTHSLGDWSNLDPTLYSDYRRGDFFSRYQLSTVAYSKAPASQASPGDVNGDGLVDSNDATAVMDEYASLSTTGLSLFNARQRAAGDADGNGLVDSNDASLILMYYTYASTGGTLPLDRFRATI
ncbi:MAG: hypothetical protein J5501_03285 [Ruminococcus sp.]|nr:hypothetical protein [Ruminococcus sp.]